MRKDVLRLETGSTPKPVFAGSAGLRSIAANDSNQAIATWSSTDPRIGINAQVRVTSGPSGAGTVLFTSPTFYNPTTDNPELWGDYSAVTIDPVLQNHAWLVNEKKQFAICLGLTLRPRHLPMTW